MEFGRKLLSRFGWEEGKGLGKLEDGIVAPLKPKLKFDTTGVGFDYSKEYVNDWWAQNYNEALKKVEVSKKAKRKKHIDDEESERTRQKSSKKFIKTETLLQDGSHVPEVDIIDDHSVEETDPVPLNFEKLFEACGGRTAHKGARHGLGLNGKLARLEAQEKGLNYSDKHSSVVPPTSTGFPGSIETSSKKKKKTKSGLEKSLVSENTSCFSGDICEEVSEEQVTRKEKKVKKSKQHRDSDFKHETRLESEEDKLRDIDRTEAKVEGSEDTRNTAKSKKRKVKKSMISSEEIGAVNADFSTETEEQCSNSDKDSTLVESKTKKRKKEVKLEISNDLSSKSDESNQLKHKKKKRKVKG